MNPHLIRIQNNPELRTQPHPWRTGPFRNVRMHEKPEVVGKARKQNAPDPIRQSDSPHRPSAVQVFVPLNVADIRAVDAWHFGGREYQPPSYATQMTGPQHRFRERVNIKRVAPTAYGSLHELSPEPDIFLR